MPDRFEFCPYQRTFASPLHTSHGRWTVREGIVLRLSRDDGRVGWGEIAPIPWFGTETIAAALEFCRQFPPNLPSESLPEQLLTIPSTLPACQFGFGCVWEMLSGSRPPLALPPLPLSGLLPAGAAALTAWKPLWQQGYHTFKWKIGVGNSETEIALFDRLLQSLPPAAKLRLDANAGLSEPAARCWLAACEAALEKAPAQVEYLEQPLPIQQFEVMQALSQEFRTPIALDESVATLTQLQRCYDRGWRGIVVIKPAIAGYPWQLRQFCQQRAIDAVFSSALETAIGRGAGLRLAAELNHPDRAVGYGTTHWFTEPDEEVLERLGWSNFATP